jgi:serine/threonine protein kinase
MSVECFIREGIMLKDYKHERILTPIGISIDENKLPMIVLPFMANGDLLKYLRKRNNSLTIQKLLSFVQQVAEGRNQLKVLFRFNH